jgi:2-keto-4-pentenoate hydratase/2-oxohepta-3-ene-1,7-dioic acid hydratase in catechol pathway
MIYNSLIQPYFDYCSPLWAICGTQLLDKLQKFQNRAARIIAGASYEIELAVVLETLGWETLKSRRQKMKSILLYKILNDYTAPNLKESLTGSSLTQANYNLRNNYTDLAKKRIPKKSFKYSGAKLWNSLSREVKEARSIHIFK